MLTIRPYQTDDDDAIVALWERCGLVRPQNDPRKDIRRKSAVRPDLFRIGLEGTKIVSTVMAGYEGHRGWINYLAVSPDRQRMGIGRQMMADVERLLRIEGCPKINLLVRTSNASVVGFYAALGYVADDVLSLGKRLEHDQAEMRPATSPPVGPDTTSAWELRQYEPVFHTEQTRPPVREFTDVLAPEFREVGASGRQYSREYVLSVLTSRPADNQSMAVCDFSCSTLTETLFLVTYTLKQSNRTTRRSSIWRRDPDGAWRIVHHQGTIVPETQQLS